MKRLPLRSAPKYLLLGAGMVFLNFALPCREPLSFALFYAALSCGFDPFLTSALYLASSAVSLTLAASLSAAVQALFLLLLAILYARFRRKQGFERFLFALLAQLPFVFLFPHTGYALLPISPVLQKLVIAAAILLCSALFEGGLNALLWRALRSRLSAIELTELVLMWLLTGMGILFSLGPIAFTCLSLAALLASVLVFGTSACIPFSAALSLPAAVSSVSPAPIAAYVVYASFALLLLPYGKFAAALSLPLAHAAAMYFEGLYAGPVLAIVWNLLAGFLPALIVFVPDRFLNRLKKTLLFYRERSLPRIAVNRSRRAVGEQLYEVSALFREIESALALDSGYDPAEGLRGKIYSSLCASCRNRRSCGDTLAAELDKLIAVGKAKGSVNLIDLPLALSSKCVNTTGLLFCVNKHLAAYTRVATELETAREGRMLLARQAHGVSEILKNMALEQSEEYVFTEEEHILSAALAREGLLSTEILLYGEGDRMTVTVTLESKASGKRLARIAGEALKTPFSLAEKIPLTEDRACFVLRRKPEFDAAFGIASRPKDGEPASGDTHSILKIDERRFLVALSDGMGSGERAREVSDRTLSLLESFYKAKMPSETVLSTVNNLIAFSSDEIFSCLDVAAVDLDTGRADVVKIGSPPAFILSGETLQVLEGESLPMGAVETVRPACLKAEMKPDDFLILMSDGVTAAFGSSSELCAYLSRLHPLNPQSLAEEILKSALGRYRGRAEDDMTVLAVKLSGSA